MKGRSEGNGPHCNIVSEHNKSTFFASLPMVLVHSVTQQQSKGSRRRGACAMTWWRRPNKLREGWENEDLPSRRHRNSLGTRCCCFGRWKVTRWWCTVTNGPSRTCACCFMLHRVLIVAASAREAFTKAPPPPPPSSTSSSVRGVGLRENNYECVRINCSANWLRNESWTERRDVK